MTTTTTYQGMDPGAKSSSRVLRPPGGETSFSFGTDDNTTPQRKNKMASSIFAEPDDPHAHRRNNPPTAGAPTGTLCGEPSAPLRRCQQPLLFPKNPQPELTTIHNSGAAMVWKERREGENGQEPNDEYREDGEVEQEDQERETPQPSAPSGGASAAAGGRRNPPGGKSSLILG
ncbi:hematological and neurological expressed 1 protein isoform X1 [Stegastes partitus]|uniref:Hematological and neurological expressed 1 protein isoform X1 n=1 Tax=Stegastes partitus TaxID=144197 RepID=A0A9Y4K3A1_9TELE|nr:PREDICTED: hematological and neurological expressed 1 protein isoform X1 [Stegastes partitus]